MIARAEADDTAEEVESDKLSPRWHGWRLTLGAFVVAEVLAGVLSVVKVVSGGRIPETFDLGNYEYYAGYAQVHGFRSPIALPGLLQTYLDTQLNTIYYVLIANLHARPAVSVIALLQSFPVALVAVLVWKLALRAGGSPVISAAAGLLAGAGAFLAPIYGIELGETASDSLLALPLIGAAALLYRTVLVARKERPGFRDAAFAGLLLGIAGELKFTTGPFIVAMLLAFLLALVFARPREGWDLRRCLLLAGLPAAVALFTAVVLYLPTALLLWHRYHDPVFPYFNGIFHSADLRPGNYRDQRWTVRSPMSFLLHYTRLLIGGDNYHNGTSQWPVRSPVMFFGIALTAVCLVFELVKRQHPEALFLEFSLVGGFVLSEAVFGIYRYLAPVEMTAVAVLVSLVFIYRPRSVPWLPLAAVLWLPVAAVLLAVGSLFALEPRLGSAEAFGPSFFDVPPGTFSAQAGGGLVLAGPAPLGYLVPYVPANTALVRTGGNLDQVMSAAWWSHVATVVRANHVRWWVVFDSGTLKSIHPALRQIGFSGYFSDCQKLITRMGRLEVCRLPAPTP